MIIINCVIAALCFAAVVIECGNGHVPSAITYGGFGSGYIGLALVYAQ